MFSEQNLLMDFILSMKAREGKTDSTVFILSKQKDKAANNLKGEDCKILRSKIRSSDLDRLGLLCLKDIQLEMQVSSWINK